MCAAIVFVAVGWVRAELPREIRVLTYNVHRAEGTDGKTDLARIAKIISAEHPDIAAVQAVDRKTKRSGGVDQAAELGRLTKMSVVFDRTIEHDGGDYGNAVLTNLPVRSHKNVKLRSYANVSPDNAERRGVQVVELGEKEGPGLTFLCTVIDWRQDQDGNDERMNSSKTINLLAAKHGDAPMILAGTMNAVPKNLSIREFAKQWKIAGVNREGTGPEAEGIGEDKKLRLLYTYPGERPRMALNQVMCRPRELWQVLEVRVVNEPVASTHLPMLAVLRRVDKVEHSK